MTSPTSFAVNIVAMRLADACGLNVARVELRETLGKLVLLIERFDRASADDKSRWHRRAMESALTMLELDEMEARYASYEAHGGDHPPAIFNRST